MEFLPLQGLGASELEGFELLIGDKILVFLIISNWNSVKIIKEHKAVNRNGKDQKDWTKKQEQQDSLHSEEPFRPLIHCFVTSGQSFNQGDGVLHPGKWDVKSIVHCEEHSHNTSNWKV